MHREGWGTLPFSVHHNDPHCVFIPLDHKFLSFKPSVVTAAAVAAARTCLHLTPTWKPALVQLTQYEYFEICECVDLMLK